MFYLLVNLELQDHSLSYSCFSKVTIHSFICPWSTIWPSFRTRPSWLLSRLIRLHALAPSVGWILKLPLSLLAFSQLTILLLFWNRLFKGVPQGGFSSLWGWLAIVLGSCPGCVEAGEAGGVHCFISVTAFLVLPIYLRQRGELSSTEKRCSWGPTPSSSLFKHHRVGWYCFISPSICEQLKLDYCIKNPAYGRHRIPRPMRIVEPIP